MGALETIGAGIAGVGAARLIMGSPKAAVGAAMGDGARRTVVNIGIGTAATAAGIVVGSAAGGAAGLALSGMATPQEGDTDPNSGFQYGMTTREKVGWGSAGIVAMGLGAGMGSGGGATGVVVGALAGAAFVGATGYVTNFTRAGE